MPPPYTEDIYFECRTLEKLLLPKNCQVEILEHSRCDVRFSLGYNNLKTAPRSIRQSLADDISFWTPWYAFHLRQLTSTVNMVTLPEP